MTRALIVDGYELFRASLREIILASGGAEEIEEAATSGGFFRAAMTGEPVSLAVIHPPSIGLSESDCLRLADRLLSEARIILFRDCNHAAANAAASHSRVAVLPRDAGCAEVAAAVAAAVAADPVANPVSQDERAALNGVPDGMAAARSLSRRQREIMAMVAEGLANKEIAHRLGIAEGTVKAHIHAVFRALGVTNRTQAVVRYGPALRAAG